jgi:sugar-specific transcriptional regulator TrmB
MNEVLQKAAKLEVDKIDELLAILDKDIEHIQDSLLRLDKLRSLLIKPNNESLDGLLESIQADSDSYVANETKRQSIRRELAATLGCDVEQMTLSKLEANLEGQQKDQVTGKKIKLKLLTEELKNEHLSTVMLLSDCAMFNSLLLKTIFDFGRTETVYYNSNGSAKRQSDAAFVNLQF